MEDFYFGSSSLRRILSKEKKIRKIHTGVYTSIMSDRELEKKMRYQWPLVVAHAFKTSVISYRTAIEFKPSPKSYIYLVSKRSTEVKIGGIKFKLIRGTLPCSFNRQALMGALTASLERAFLESLIVPKIKISDDRYLPLSELEDKLEQLLTQSGDTALNLFRDNARLISIELGLPSSLKKLDKIIGGLLGSKQVKLHGKRAINRASGLLVDEKRIDLFLSLAAHLETIYYPKMVDENLDNTEHFENKAFFESYFSNYIEGTDFQIEEAEKIVFDKQNIENRINDSQDIYGTFKIVSNKSFMTTSPKSFLNFIDDIKMINKEIIPTRQDKKPGEFKTKENRAGNTLFVHPDYVYGTLKKAFEISASIIHPIAKSIFRSFIISEIHPFSDGNGRTCRIVLNRELLSTGHPSIIIPNVYREDYVGALKAISKKGRVKPLTDMFIKALKFSNLDFTNYQLIKKEITKRNWFLSPDEGKIVY